MSESDDVESAVVKAARDRLGDAYAPHSNFHVGAAVRVPDGSIFTGVNIENDNYTNTRHAEGVAIMKAVDAGYRSLTHVAVTVQPEGETEQGELASPEPCGTCKQTITQFIDDSVMLLLGDGNDGYRAVEMEKEFTL